MKRRVTVHLCPAPGSGLTACCGKTPFELPIGDRIALQVARVTCHAARNWPQSAATDRSGPEGHHDAGIAQRAGKWRESPCPGCPMPDDRANCCHDEETR